MDRQVSLDVSFPVTYRLEESPGSRRGLLVLHGYSDHARSARRRLLGSDPVEGHWVLSPNALFPSPVRDGDSFSFKEAYSWYFRDPKTGAQMSSPEFAAENLVGLVRKLKLESLEWVIVGFSQGGFFAPYVKRAGLDVRAIVSVGAGYRREAYEGLAPVRVRALHGQADEIVPPQLARESFETIASMGYGVDFHELPGVGHTLDDAGRRLVRALLEEESALR